MEDAVDYAGRDWNHESTRDRIFSTAKRLFSKNGFTGTSIRDITEEAGVNVAAVNYHFGGKENLYLEILAERTKYWQGARMEAISRAVEGTDNPKAALEAGIRAFVRFNLASIVSSEDCAEDCALFFREISSPGLGFEIIMRELIAPTRKAIHDLLAGVIPGITQESSFLVLSSMIGQMTHFVRSRRVVTKALGREYDAELIDKICEHIVAFSMGGLRAYGVE
ncbi:TetR/AcrR family transcriptional regulator [bacterium]|nr:MAG: TetR/AcrR family transcriptional regulator [bacterium]